MQLLVTLLPFIAFCNGAKILGVFNHPGASHTFLGKVLLKNLAEKGHHVVMISSFPMKEHVPNYRDISLPEHLEDLQRRSMMYFVKEKTSSLDELKNMTLKHTEDTFTNSQVKELLQSEETFDVIIMDWFFNEATLIFGHIYNAPVIFMSSFGNMALLNDFTGNTLPYSYVPGAGMLTHDEMSFKDRVIMTMFNIIYTFYIPRRNMAHYEILKRHFKNPPTVEELQENIALVLSNSHFSFETPRPYTPNIIPIGGFHIQDLKQLPQDLKTFLDSAKEAFGKVPQKVLWKYEADDLSDIPKNIKILKWIPQLEVLAHPNVKLFVTHGGSLSFIEAIYFQVPLLCIPFNGDQFTNAAFTESRNIGLQILPDNITEETLINLLQEITTNPKYQEQINYRSTLLREQPVKPLDLARFWVEHVIKHKRTDHLKTFATKLPWYKYYLVDVIACGGNCAKILGIGIRHFSVPSKSHHILGSRLLRALAEKGHEVTMISPFPLKSKVTNYRDIFLEEMLQYKE
ncbi:UDP-glucuronosyltransferase 1-7-like, partial [Asbolus verrucosus]